MATATADWKDEARQLREQGLSEREIAEAVGKAPSSVHEALKDQPANGRVSSEQAQALEDAAGITADREAAQPSPGQQTIDGGEVSASPAPVEELRVDGTTQLGLIDFGGKRPQSATITLRGGAYELLEGRAFAKGDVVHFSGTAVVSAIGAVDKHDPKTGIVVSAKQTHVARITDLTVSPAE